MNVVRVSTHPKTGHSANHPIGPVRPVNGPTDAPGMPCRAVGPPRPCDGRVLGVSSLGSADLIALAPWGRSVERPSIQRA